MFLIVKTDNLPQAIKHLSITHFDDVLALKSKRLQRVGGDHAELGIGSDLSVNSDKFVVSSGDGSTTLIVPTGSARAVVTSTSLRSLRHKPQAPVVNNTTGWRVDQ